ncbi:MAG: hypothetical protein JWM93_1745 [Frankiales bacterium]|nr:hypothetical protein [Frankiales bacterium]
MTDRPRTTGPRSRRAVVWVLVLVALAGGAVAGAFATERYQAGQISHLVAAHGQVERFGDHDTYLLVWNDEIFANLVPIPENWLAQLPEGARVRVFYSPVTQQVVLRSRRYDAPQLCLVLAGAFLVAALVVLRRSRARTPASPDIDSQTSPG